MLNFALFLSEFYRNLLTNFVQRLLMPLGWDDYSKKDVYEGDENFLVYVKKVINIFGCKR